MEKILKRLFKTRNNKINTEGLLEIFNFFFFVEIVGPLYPASCFESYKRGKNYIN